MHLFFAAPAKTKTQISCAVTANCTADHCLRFLSIVSMMFLLTSQGQIGNQASRYSLCLYSLVCVRRQTGNPDCFFFFMGRPICKKFFVTICLTMFPPFFSRQLKNQKKIKKQKAQKKRLSPSPNNRTHPRLRSPYRRNKRGRGRNKQNRRLLKTPHRKY